MLIISLIQLLCSNAVATRRDKSILYARIAITIFVITFILTLEANLFDLLKKDISLFGGLYHTNTMTQSFSCFIFILTCFILMLNAFYPRKLWTDSYSWITTIITSKLVYYNNYILNKKAENFRILEYPLIILFAVIGGIFLMSCSDLISVFLSIELQSYALYILCTVYRNSERATSGGLTYFLLGGLSSCFILLASGLLYGNSGNTSFDGLYIINNISKGSLEESLKSETFEFFKLLKLNQENSSWLNPANWYESYYINFSMALLSVGFLFKVSAAPFHFWSPDVYDSIPTVVTSFVAIFAKISIFILLLELVHYTTDFYSNSESSNESSRLILSNTNWTFTLIISSLLSLIIGSILGLTQFRIKRLYAYSTISHVGFILLALTINSIESIQAFVFYLIQYSISNLNAFIILITIGYSLYLYIEKIPSNSENKKEFLTSNLTNNSERFVTSGSEITDKDNSPLQLISQLKGYFFINSYLALSLAITFFSFLGVPPLVGFFAKQMVLSSALDSGYVFMTLIAILTSVISACYYLALIKQMFFDKTNYMLNPVIDNISIKTKIIKKNENSLIESSDLNLKIKNIVLSSSLSVTISILTLFILLFILNPQEWLSLANMLTIILFKV